jgi:nucleoside diphosphate kinase
MKCYYGPRTFIGDKSDCNLSDSCLIHWPRVELHFDEAEQKYIRSVERLFFSLQANLNDSHNQMVVHWAGEKSNVIVALARDSVGATGPKTSSVSTQ